MAMLMAPSGETLRRLRKERGLSIALLARLAGVGERTIHLYEAHNLPPRTKEARERLCRFFGVSEFELFPCEGGDSKP